MTIEQIKAITKRLYAINDDLLNKTGKKSQWGGLDLVVKDDQCIIRISTDYESNGGYHYGTAKGDTPEAALDAAEAIISAMPDPERAKLQAHLSRVADCVDKARADNIADEYVMPLRTTIAAISNNLLASPEETE